MKSINIPTHKDMYMISYLVFNGWEPNYDCSSWKKDGHSHKIAVTKHDKHGYFEAEEDTEWFDLEDAFWEQKDLEV